MDLARRLGFDVRTDQGPFHDGNCRLEDRNIIVLNRASPLHRRVAALSLALSECSLDGLFLLPALRSAIEKARGCPENGSSMEEAEKASTYSETNSQPSSPREATWQNQP